MIVSTCRPSNLDIYAPPRNRQLWQLMNEYRAATGTWGARAMNCNYFNSDGSALGLIYREGIYHAEANTAWPVLCVHTDGIAYMRDGWTYSDMVGVRIAFGAGPRLLRTGQIIPPDLELFKGVDITSHRPRAGIGIRGDGLIVHIVIPSGDWLDLAAALQNHGAMDGLALDGGGSVSVYDAQGRPIFGKDTRKLPSALIMLKLVEVGSPLAAQEPPKTSDDTRRTDPAPNTPTGANAGVWRDYAVLVVRSPADDVQLAPHFRASEFASRASGLVIVRRELIERLEWLRTKAQRPVSITSGYRSIEHNRAVGGVPDSQHVYGRAADITVRGLNVDEVAKLAEQAGFRGIGRYPRQGFVHCDVREGTPVRWEG